MIAFQSGNGQGTRPGMGTWMRSGMGSEMGSGMGSGIFCRWAGRPAGRLAVHGPWPGTFSIRHILTHTRIMRLTLLTRLSSFGKNNFLQNWKFLRVPPKFQYPSRESSVPLEAFRFWIFHFTFGQYPICVVKMFSTRLPKGVAQGCSFRNWYAISDNMIIWALVNSNKLLISKTAAGTRWPYGTSGILDGGEEVIGVQNSTSRTMGHFDIISSSWQVLESYYSVDVSFQHVSINKAWYGMIWNQ